MRRLKILHLITTLPRLSGAADNTRYTVNLLNAERYDVHLACGPAELDASQVAPHVRLIVIQSLVRPIALLRDCQAAWNLYRLLRRERYDIVHTHNAKAGVLGRIAARLAGVPVVVHTAHSISFVASTSALVNYAYRIADRACAVLCARIITVSALNTKTYLEAGVGRPDQYVTIYSGVETAKFANSSHRLPCRFELGVGDRELLVVWIGRLNRQKDPLTFVRAARLLSNRVPQARFVMVGDDPLGESLENQVRDLIAQLRLETTVRLLGYRADVERMLAAADLVLHTSLYEGLARSVIEAMLARVPIVATSVDGVQEAVVSGTRGGLLVPPNNPPAVVEAAMRLIDNPGLAAGLAAAGQSWARERFEVKDMVGAIDQLYSELSRDHIHRQHELGPESKSLD